MTFNMIYFLKIHLTVFYTLSRPEVPFICTCCVVALLKNNTYVYKLMFYNSFISVPVIGASGLLTVPMCRSLLSKLTRSDQQGK